MNIFKSKTSTILLLISISLFEIGCTINNKQENNLKTKINQIDNDSLKNSAITFFRRIDNQTGEQIGKANAFTIMEEGRVHASVNLKDFLSNYDKDRDIMLHFDWINPEGYSFYQRRENIAVDSSTVVNSSISLSPDLRKDGKYKLRVYLFRKLVLEKSFELLPKFQLENYNIEKKEIALITKFNRKTKKHKKGDTDIVSMNGKWIEAAISLANNPNYDKEELLFRYDWVGEDGEVFYRKRIDSTPKDSVIVLKSSLSVSPEDRKPGNYTTLLYLFDELLARADYTLLPPLDPKKIKSQITFCSSVDKKTKKRSGIGDTFRLENKNKVYACVDLKNCLVYGDQELNFRLKWINTKDGKSFFSKRYNFVPKELTKTLMSAISISPKKRKRGTYKLEVLLFNEPINEREFKLKPALSLNNLNTKIILYSKEDKKTGIKTGVDSSFIIKDKNKVRLLIDIKNPLVFGKRNLDFRVEWIGTDDKPFFSKNTTINPSESVRTIKGAISIPPNKRRPGNYKIRLFLSGKLIKEKKFVLISE